MAARINTKLVLIVFIVLALAVGGVLGLFFVRDRLSGERHIRAGLQLLEDGNPRRAKTEIGRAVTKEPENLEYVGHFIDALLQITPETADEARELYRTYLNALNQRAVHHPTDAQLHMDLIVEVHRSFRRSGAHSGAFAQLLSESAESMWTSLPESEPRREEARFYRGLARLHPSIVAGLTEDELAAAVTDLEEYLGAKPQAPEAWAALVHHHLDRAEHFRGSQPSIADEHLAQARAALDAAQEPAGDSAEVLLARVRFMLLQRVIDPALASDGDLRALAEAAVAAVEAADQPWIVRQAVDMIQRLGAVGGGLSRAIAIVDEHLASHSDDLDMRHIKGILHYYASESDPARAAAEQVLAAPPLTVSYLAQLEFELKRRAASLLVDIEARRWDVATREERPSIVPAIEAARERLAGIVALDTDPLLARADAKIAYVKGDNAKATRLFDQVVKGGVDVDFETEMYYALSLQRLGETGAAIERFERGVELQPWNTLILNHLTALLFQVGRFEDANVSNRKVLALDPQNERALALRAEIEPRLASGSTMLPPAGDPTVIAIEQAERAAGDGEYDVALATLDTALARLPDSLLLINAKIRVLLLAERHDEARTWVDRGLALSPNNPTYTNYKNLLDNPDIFDRLRLAVEQGSESERDRTVDMLMALRELVRVREQRAVELEKAGQTQEAAVQRAIVERARAEGLNYAAKAKQVAADHPQYIEYRFGEALGQQDWAEAERVVADASRLNADQADGALYQGRLQIARKDLGAAVLSLEQATARLPYSARAWRLLAIARMGLGRNAEAIEAYGKAHFNNPSDVTTVRLYAEALTRAGNPTRALDVLRGGRRLAPTNAGLREQWLRLEYDAGDRAVVLAERRRVYKRDPKDRLNAASLALFLGTTKPVRELLLDEAGQPVHSAEQWGRIPQEAVRGEQSRAQIIAREQDAWRAEADRITEELGATGPRDLAWHALRADLLRAHGSVAEGEAILRSYADAQTDRTERLAAIIALGSYQSQAGLVGPAVATYRAAIADQPEDARPVDRRLADLYFQRNMFTEAIPHFEAVLAVEPERALELQLVECLVKLKSFADAQRRLEEFEQRGGADATSTLLMATIVDGEAQALWDDNKHDEAESLWAGLDHVLRTAEQLDPGIAMPHILRAADLFKRYQRTQATVHLDDAMRSLARADEVQANVPRTYSVRAAIYSAQRNVGGAINELNRVLELTPDDDEARQFLISLYVRNGRWADGLAVARVAVERNPGSAVWFDRIGDLHGARLGEVEDALRTVARGSRQEENLKQELLQLTRARVDAYRAAILIVPDPNVIAKCAQTLMTATPPQPALAVTVIEGHPEAIEASPVVRTIYARAIAPTAPRESVLDHLRIAYRALRQWIAEKKLRADQMAYWFGAVYEVFGAKSVAEAERFANDLAGGKPDAYELLSLARMWQLSGPDGLSRRAELLAAATAICPKDDEQRPLALTLYRELGFALLQLQQNREALDAMRKVCELNPEDAEAANNVAYLLAETMNQPAEALPYAKRAIELKPGDWSILDTIGWVHFRLDQLPEAERYLRESVAVRENASNLYHLAALRDRQGDHAQALKHAERAAELQPDPETQSQLNRLTDDIKRKLDRR